MSGFSAINHTTGQILADRVNVARSFFQRTKGLLGRNSMERGEGLYISKCASIHTFFMKFAIDVLFLDKDMIVTRAIIGIKPYGLAFSPWSTTGVLEFWHGALEDTPCSVGDRISITETGGKL